MKLPDRTDVFLIDGVRFSFQIERQAFARMSRAMRAVERVPKGKVPGDAVALSALGSAWTIVDAVHRIRGLIAQVRGLTHRSTEMQLFFRAASPVEEVRNFLQHLSSAVPKLGEGSVPLMGQLRWGSQKSGQSVALSVGHWTQDTYGLSLAVDLRTMQLVNNIQFAVAEISVDLRDLHERCRRLADLFEGWLKANNLLSDADTRPSTIRFGVPVPADA
jgi:hypothetical protein